jgi:beta-lactamase class A
MTLVGDLQAIIDEAGIEAGLAVWHLESGERTNINADALFPMASVFKIPILATAARQLADGRLSLDTRILLKDEDKSTGSGILPFFDAGLTPTVRDLLTLMIIISDNTATDITVGLLGGSSVVEETMRTLGIDDIYFKMNCKELLKSLFPPEVAALPLEELKAWDNENDILRDGLAFSRAGDNNTSTALAMTELIAQLFRGEIVAGETRDEMLDILLKQQFNQRLPRLLPPSVKFAHKTGTIGGICNDAGVMTIDDNTHVVVTLFTLWDDAAVWKDPEAKSQRVVEVETAMGKIGRCVYRHYAGVPV